jgi:hypothetical protein
VVRQEILNVLVVNFQGDVLLLVSGCDPFYDGVVLFYGIKVDQSVWLVDVLL